MHTTTSDRRCAMLYSNTTPVKILTLVNTQSSSLMYVSAAEHHTAEKYSKEGTTKPPKHLTRSNLSLNTQQDFLRIINLWEAAQEIERRCFSKVALESNVTPNMARSSDSFNTVLPIVNGGATGCIVLDLGTIIAFVLLAFNFIPNTSHHSRKYLAEVTIQGLCNYHSPGDGTTAIKVESSAYLLAYSPVLKIAPRRTRGTITGLKHNVHQFTPKIIETPTLTCCNRFDRNCVIHWRSLNENSLMVNPLNCCAEVNLHKITGITELLIFSQLLNRLVYIMFCQAYF